MPWFSCRFVVILGSVICTLGVLISAFMPDLPYLYLTYGVLGGVGRAFVYAPSLIMVGYYFNKRRGVAVGLATSGIGVGCFVFPPVVEIMFNHYGFQGTFLILAGVMSNFFVCGALFRSLEMQKQIIKTDRIKKMLAENPTKRHLLPVAMVTLKQNSQPSQSAGAFNLTFVFLPALAKDKGIPQLDGAMLVSILGIFDAIARVVMSTVLDLKRVKPYRLIIYNAVMFGNAAVAILIPSMTQFWHFAMMSGLFGFLSGTYISQKSVVVVDVLGVKSLSSSFGLLLLFQGLSAFIGPTVG
ncbi:MOT12-like protein, partial [Mya arenaria]